MKIELQTVFQPISHYNQVSFLLLDFFKMQMLKEKNKINYFIVLFFSFSRQHPVKRIFE